MFFVFFTFFPFYFCFEKLRSFSFSFFFFVKVLYIRAGRASRGRFGRSRHRPTNQSFRVCQVNLATLKVATIQWFAEIYGKETAKAHRFLWEEISQETSSTSFTTSRSVLRHCGSFECAGDASGICQQGRIQCRRTVWTRTT